MVKTVCKNCGEKQKVELCKPTKRTFCQQLYDIAKKFGAKEGFNVYRQKEQSEKGVPATSVPCPKCGQHKLRRLRLA